MSRTMLTRVALILAIMFAVTMALLPKPPHMPIDQFGDKAGHMLAFATMALLAALSFPTAKLFRIGERLSFLGAMIEVLQSIPSLHRDCDIHDRDRRYAGDHGRAAGGVVCAARARRPAQLGLAPLRPEVPCQHCRRSTAPALPTNPPRRTPCP
jgi:hypothetical protein